MKMKQKIIKNHKKITLFIINVIIISTIISLIPTNSYAYRDIKFEESVFSPLSERICIAIPTIRCGRIYNDRYVDYWFYPVESWEIDLCTRRLQKYKSVNDNEIILEGFGNVYKTAVNIAGYKKVIDENETLYDISWYIQPATGEIKYSIYLWSNKHGKYYIPKSRDKYYKDEVSDYMQGSTGSFTQYLNKNFTHLKLEYKQRGEELNEFVLELVEVS